MKKLFSYLSKIGIQESRKHGNHDEAPAVFYRETYGDNNYFYNAPNHTHAGAVVALDYNAEAPQSYFENLRQIERKIESYCKKYGYRYTRRACYGVAFYTVEKIEDREAADAFYYFRDAARAEVDAAAHELYTAGKYNEVEAAARRIMDKYGAAYNEFLKEIETA